MMTNAIEYRQPAGTRRERAAKVDPGACGRRAGRAGYAVLGPGGTPVGEVTSGALSPTLGHPIALAFVDPAFAAVGTALALDVRGTSIPATVTALPFYRREK